jgi:hypothetical protein
MRATILAVLTLAALPRVLSAQFPQSIAPVPVARSVMPAAPGETFAISLSSTVQNTPLTIQDNAPGASQVYSGAVVLTPTWDLNNNRQVTIYAYISQQFINASSATLPNSVVEASATGGSGSANGAWTPFASTVDGHPSGVTLTSVLARGSNKTVSDAREAITVSLRLNTTGVYFEPGRYTGVVTFGAHVQ